MRFHGTWTYRPYVLSRCKDLPSVRTKFTVHGLTVRTYQTSRYTDLPPVRTKFHGTRSYRPHVPNFTVQRLTVRTYQISRSMDLPSVCTNFMNTSLGSDVNENINIKTTLTEKTLILQAYLLSRRETTVNCKRMSV